MTDRKTLRTLKRASRGRPVERWLVCPKCGNQVDLAGGRLWCRTTERHGSSDGLGGFKTLAELAVEERQR